MWIYDVMWQNCWKFFNLLSVFYSDLYNRISDVVIPKSFITKCLWIKRPTTQYLLWTILTTLRSCWCVTPFQWIWRPPPTPPKTTIERRHISEYVCYRFWSWKKEQTNKQQKCENLMKTTSLKLYDIFHNDISWNWCRCMNAE